MAEFEQEAIAKNEQISALTENVDDLENQERDEAIANFQEDEEMLKLNHEITTELTNSSMNVTNQDILEAKQITDSITLRAVANKRIEKCEQLSDSIHSTEWNGRSKRQLKKNLKWAIKDMNNMIEDIDTLEESWWRYNSLDVNKNRLGEIIYYYYTNREPARQMITLWKRVPHINWLIDSERDAKRMWRFINNSQEHQQKMAELLKDPMLLHLLWDDQHALSQYYADVINWHIEPSTHPFYTQHMQSFQLMKKVSPELYWNLAPRMPWQITYNTYCQRNPQLYPQYLKNNNIICHPQSFNDRLWHKITDIMAKVFPWIDSDPRKRQAWEKAWSIAALGWAVVLGFKFLQSLFSKKHDWKRKEVGLFWWWLLALLNADKIVNWTQDAFGWHPAEKTKMLTDEFQTYWFTDKQAIEIADRYIWAPVTTMAALHFIPMYDLESKNIIKNEDGEFVFDVNNYNKFIDQLAWDENHKEQVKKAWEKLDKDKCIWAWLGALWIKTREKFKSLFNWDKNKTLAQTEEAQKGYAKAVERVKSWVNKVLHEQWLRVKNPDDMDKIMEEYGTWQKSRKEINALILDWMKRDLLEFSSDKKLYTIKEMLNDSEYTSEINFDKMTMRWLKYSEWANEIEFSTYTELFETVHITNWIKKHFAWREDAKDARPFHFNERWQLEFNNTEWYEIYKNETAVIWLRKLRKDLSTINKNKEAYEKYLNDWRFSQL